MLNIYTHESDGKEETGGWSWYDTYMKRSSLKALQRKIYSLAEGESLNVCYFGGSITNGSGLTGDGAPWRITVGDYLTAYVKNIHKQENVINEVLYPSQPDFHICKPGQITIKNINAGIGATGSYFGVHRLEKMLAIDKGLSPDLVFLEFAVNDYWDKREYVSGKKKVLACAADYEAIIQKLYLSNPEVCIIALFTNLIFTEDYIDYQNNPALAAQRAVLRHYNLPYLYIGLKMYQECMKCLPEGAEKFTAENFSDRIHDKAWSRYYSDNCHPNAAGYRYYANIITDYLETALKNSASPLPLPESPFHPPEFLKLDASYINCAELYENCSQLLSGWQPSEYIDPEKKPYLAVSLNGSLQSEAENASFSFSFTGNSVGFWVARSMSGGILHAHLYNEQNILVKKASMALGYEEHDGLAEPWDIASNLEYGKYIVKIWVKRSTYGVSGRLRKLFINGDIRQVLPLQPPFYIRETEPFQNVKKDVFLNASGLVTMEDMTEYAAYTTLTEALECCMEDGTIHFEGSFSLPAAETAKSLTLKGIGRTAARRSKNVIIVSDKKMLEHWNVSFENLTLKLSADISAEEISPHIIKDVFMQIVK